MRCTHLVLAILAAAAVVQAAPPMKAVADDWRTYHNERYGTTIDYPDFFKAGRRRQTTMASHSRAPMAPISRSLRPTTHSTSIWPASGISL
jgi:hypothetical protein